MPGTTNMPTALDSFAAKKEVDLEAALKAHQRILVGPTHWNVAGEGSFDPIASDNDTAIASVLSDVAIAGGGKVHLPRLLKINDPHVIPDSVDVIGHGSSQEAGASVVKCLSAGAGLRFGDIAGGSSGGVVSGFKVDGMGVATEPFYCGVTVGRLFHNIDIVNSADVGLMLDGTQNCTYIEVNVQHSALDGVRLDRGAGTNKLMKCEFGTSGRYGGNIVATSLSVIYTVPWPLNNVFDTCLFEYDQPGALAMFHAAAGTDNTLTDCTFASGGNVPILLDIEVAGVATFNVLRVRDGAMAFNNPAAGNIAVRMRGSSQFLQTGHTTILQADRVGRYEGTGILALWDRPLMTACTTWAELTGGAQFYQVRRQFDTLELQVSAGVGGATHGIPYIDPLTGALLGYARLYPSA